MKKICTLCFLLFVNAFFANAQMTVFQKAFGGSLEDYGFDVVATADGGYAMAGYSNSFSVGNDYDVLLIKLDADANILWTHTYGGSGNDQSLQLVQTSDGGFAISGKTNSFGSGSFDALLIKTDGNGDLQWMKTYGGAAEERLINLRETTDHGFLLAGSTLSYGQGNFDMLFIKTDSVGDTLWTKIIGGINSDQGTDAEQTSDGGYLLLGRAMSWGSGSNDIFIEKTDANGDSVWTRVLGSSGWDEGIKVKETNDGEYIVTGASTGFTNLSYDVFLNKIDTAGNLTWSKLYSGINADATYDVVQLADSGYIVAGETESFGINHLRPDHSSLHTQSIIQPVNTVLGTDHSNVLVIRTDANGDTLWSRAYGGNKLDEAYAIIQTPDSGFMTIAFSNSFNADTIDFYLIKSDKNGFSSCFETPAPVDVITPPTIIMNISPQIISGLNVTSSTNTLPVPTAIQHNICSFTTTGINEAVASVHELTIFPNPVNDKLYVNSYLPHDDQTVVGIYNMLGEKVSESKIMNTGKQFEIDVSKLSQGIYTFHYASREEIIVKKFVKE